MNKNHPADKFKKEEKHLSLEQRLKERKKRGVPKKVKMVLEKIQNNKAICRRKKLINEESGIFIPGIGTTGENEEFVLEILMIGNITDTHYEMGLEVGDLILVTEVAEDIREEESIVETDKGENIEGYYIADVRHIIAKVSYTKV